MTASIPTAGRPICPTRCRMRRERGWTPLGLSPGEPERFSNGLGEGMLAALLSLASEGVGAPAKGLAVCLGAVLLFAAFGALGGEGIGKTAGYAAVCAAAGGLFPLVQTVLTAVCAVGGTGKFMAAFVPVYAGILLAGGKAATAAGFQTLLLFAATAASGVIGGLVIPFVSLYTALSFSASATSLPVGRLTEGIKKAATWLLGLLLTLFCGVLGIQTAVSAAGDSLSMKTVRFVAGSFLPVVGASVGEALGTVEVASPCCGRGWVLTAWSACWPSCCRFSSSSAFGGSPFCCRRRRGSCSAAGRLPHFTGMSGRPSRS